MSRSRIPFSSWCCATPVSGCTDPGKWRYTEAIEVSGLTGTTLISASSSYGKVERRSGNSWVSVNSATPIASGDMIRLGIVASGNFSTTQTVTFSFGPAGNRIARNWSIVTGNGLSASDPLIFDAMNNVAFSTQSTTVWTQANAVVVSGLSGSSMTKIQKTGSGLTDTQYRVNGGAWRNNTATSNSYVVSNGDIVEVRTKSTSSGLSTAIGSVSTVSLTVGSSMWDWSVTMDDGLDAAALTIPDRYFDGISSSPTDSRTTQAITGAENALIVGPMEIVGSTDGSSDSAAGFWAGVATQQVKTARYLVEGNVQLGILVTIPSYAQSRTYRIMVGSTPVSFTASTAAYRQPTFSIPAATGAYSGGACNAGNANASTSGLRLGPFDLGPSNGPATLSAVASGTGITAYVSTPAGNTFGTSSIYPYTLGASRPFYVWVCANAAQRTGTVTVNAAGYGAASGQQTYSTVFAVSGN